MGNAFVLRVDIGVLEGFLFKVCGGEKRRIFYGLLINAKIDSRYDSDIFNKWVIANNRKAQIITKRVD